MREIVGRSEVSGLPACSRMAVPLCCPWGTATVRERTDVKIRFRNDWDSLLLGIEMKNFFEWNHGAIDRRLVRILEQEEGRHFALPALIHLVALHLR